MSEMVTIVQIRSFCERQEGYHASGIIDFLHFRCFQRNYNMRAIVKISLILHKFLIQTIHPIPYIMTGSIYLLLCTIRLFSAIIIDHRSRSRSSETEFNSFKYLSLP